MKILLFGNNAAGISDIVQSQGFEVVEKNPDTVISYGGDGTLLTSERLYPGIPKLPLRDSLVCKKCVIHEDKLVLKVLSQHKLKLKKYKKLTTKYNGQDLYALNDFVVRNSDPTHTIRFKTTLTNNLFIGDGIVAATPFGSTGYFKSITRQFFERGFGIAFNNTTEEMKPIYLNDKGKIGFELIRGKAVLTYDNNPQVLVLEEGKKLLFWLSGQVARIYSDTSLRCPDCIIRR